MQEKKGVSEGQEEEKQKEEEEDELEEEEEQKGVFPRDGEVLGGVIQNKEERGMYLLLFTTSMNIVNSSLCWKQLHC